MVHTSRGFLADPVPPISSNRLLTQKFTLQTTIDQNLHVGNEDQFVSRVAHRRKQDVEVEQEVRLDYQAQPEKIIC